MAPVRFLLNGVPRSEDVSPTMTVLDWLRGPARLTGTKEGCAEGDCGACTIVVARMRDGVLRHEAVNSCLMVLPQLDGAAVLTVEGVADGGKLHPVQQALLDADATQCGFCTPGFVMAMIALQQEGGQPDDVTIHEALAGNLCRCTGYRAIVDACRRLPPPLPTTRNPAPPARSCGEYRSDGQVLFAPSSLDELLALVAGNPDAVLLAGGTDLGLRISKGRERWPLVISTAAVEELRRIATTASTLEVGGAATYTDLLPHLDTHFRTFAALVRRIGSRQIRNLGTLAGNIATASPIGDTLPCLVALGATVRLRSQAGARALPVEDFVTGYRTTALAPGEIIEGVSIPLVATGTQFEAYKVSKRFDQDISTLVAAFCLKVDGDVVVELRAAFGGMASRVQRATSLERALAGHRWDTHSVADAEAMLAEDFAPISDLRGSAAYRLHAAAGLVRRFAVETTLPGTPVRLEAL